MTVGGGWTREREGGIGGAWRGIYSGRSSASRLAFRSGNTHMYMYEYMTDSIPLSSVFSCFIA